MVTLNDDFILNWSMPLCEKAIRILIIRGPELDGTSLLHETSP